MIDWGSWRNEPVLLGGLILLGWLYALVCGPLRPRLAPGQGFERQRAIAFYAGLLVLYVALGSPLDWVGRYFLLTAHTVQLMLVLFPAPALLLFGLADWMVDPVLTGAWRRPLWRLVFHPVIDGALFVLVVSAGYLPRLLEPGLRNGSVHQVEQAMFLGVGLLFWWQLLSPSRVFRRLGYGTRMLFLSAVEVALTGVFTYILMAEHAMYPTYEHAPRLIASLTANEDQTLAGVLLSAISSLVLVGALGATFHRWAQTER